MRNFEITVRLVNSFEYSNNFAKLYYLSRTWLLESPVKFVLYEPIIAQTDLTPLFGNSFKFKLEITWFNHSFIRLSSFRLSI